MWLLGSSRVDIALPWSRPITGSELLCSRHGIACAAPYTCGCEDVGVEHPNTTRVGSLVKSVNPPPEGFRARDLQRAGAREDQEGARGLFALV